MRGYKRSASDELTSPIKDYLEMICRMGEGGDPIRVSSPAVGLHVKPSSAPKMLDNLKKARYIDSKKYGSIMVTEKRYEEDKYLLHRHQILQDFFCTLSHTENELELVEKTEHFIDHRTAANTKQVLPFLRLRNGITGEMG